MYTLARSLVMTAVLTIAAVVFVLAAGTDAQERAQQTELPRRAQKEPPALTAPRPKPVLDEPAVAPISMSDPDGQELILEDLSVRTAVQGMLSLTELELRFRNPQDRRIEGRFSCTLPANAAISRWAKEVNGQLMEGEVVERLRANQVYEQFLHQMRDPALLEQEQGNRFSARIFPIEAKAPVRLILSYTTLLPLRDGVRTYTFPLRGTAKMGRFSFRATVAALPGEESPIEKSSSSISGPSAARRSKAEVITIDEENFTPDHDIELTWAPTAEAPRARVLKAGDFYLTAFRPSITRAARPAPHSWLFYIDTSASGAEGAEHRVRALQAVLRELPPNDDVQLRAFDNEITNLGSGTAAEMAQSMAATLRKRLFLGGTDLGGMLRNAAAAAKQNPNRAIVVASDLVATLGTTERNELTDVIRTLSSSTTVHALILGSRQDAPIAKELTAGRGRVITIPFTEGIDNAARVAAFQLREPLGETLTVSDRGAEWVYPTRFDDVRNGDEVIVLGKLKVGGEPAAMLRGATTLNADASVQSLPAGTFAPLLEREAYRAYLDYLAEREANETSEAVRKALATEQVKVSVEQRVVIPRTTMLVLESEWDYRRFGLDRRALAEILTVDATGIGRLDRKIIAPLQPRIELQQKAAEQPARRMREEREQAVAPPPPPVDAAAPPPADFVMDAVQETTTVTASAPVIETSAVAESITVTGGGTAIPEPMTFNAPPELGRNPSPRTSPPPRPRPTPTPSEPPPPPRQSERRDEKRTTWWRRTMPTRAEVEALDERLRTSPRDRELYNQLSEALGLLGEWRELRALALRWQPYDPENPQVYEVLGLADEQLGNDAEAARAIASLIEVAPGKPELLQRAGLLLLRASKASIAETPLRRALELRPDRVNSYRHLGLLLWQLGRLEEAARVLEAGTRQTFPNWYGNAHRVVHEELGYVYRAWLRKEPSRAKEINERAREYAVDLDRTDAMRVTLAWETDANDVDLHVVDPKGQECYYGNMETKSGLRLYEDIRQGLGPEVVRTDKLLEGTYHFGVRYFASGPMGVSRGIVIVMTGDAKDHEPRVSVHPFRLVKGGEAIRLVASLDIK